MDMSLSKFWELQKVGHDWTIELNWTEKIIWEVDYIRVICPWAEEMPMIAMLKPWGHLLWFFDQTVEIALAPSTYCLLFPFLRFLLLYATSATYFISFSILPSMLHLLSLFFSPKLISPNLKWSKVVSMYLIDWVYLLRMISLKCFIQIKLISFYWVNNHEFCYLFGKEKLPWWLNPVT